MFYFFFFNDTATTEIYTLSLHDALPIYKVHAVFHGHAHRGQPEGKTATGVPVYNVSVQLLKHSYPERPDRKSTRLNSSHANISYAVFCLKKKKKKTKHMMSYNIEHHIYD